MLTFYLMDKMSFQLISALFEDSCQNLRYRTDILFNKLSRLPVTMTNAEQWPVSQSVSRPPSSVTSESECDIYIYMSIILPDTGYMLKRVWRHTKYLCLQDNTMKWDRQTWKSSDTKWEVGVSLTSLKIIWYKIIRVN